MLSALLLLGLAAAAAVNNAPPEHQERVMASLPRWGYSGSEAEQSGRWMPLLKSALRTVSGLVGNAPRTIAPKMPPTAQIGVRG